MNFFKRNKNLRHALSVIAGGAISSVGLYFLYKYFSKDEAQKEKTKFKLLTLTQNEAEERESRVSNVSYNIFLQLNPDTKSNYTDSKFEGSIKVEFKLENNDKPLFLDFAGNVSYIEINGKQVSVLQEGERLILRKEHLVKETNKVTINFHNFYSHRSKGLCYFHDKSDFKSYVFSNLEPCYTHLLFPCFNQPSIKADIKFSASTMEDWSCFSSGKLNTCYKSKTQIEEITKKLTSEGLILPDLNQNFAIHDFENVKNIPIYLFGLTAGHYEKATSAEGVTVYMRSSVYHKNIHYSSIPNTINSAYNYLKTNLSTDIQKTEINVFFVPHLDTDSTPSSSCFLVNDNLLVEEEKETISFKILLHAMLISMTSQLWFGVNVTPKWFDDIWLSKSLGCFFGFFILKQLSENDPEFFGDFKEAWVLFGNLKSQAIEADKYQNAHALNNEVTFLSQAALVLDEITLFKGATIFRNFYNYIGPELFFKGLRNLIKHKLGKLITFSDFKASYQNLTEERDLKINPISYIEPFITYSGINELKVNYSLNEENKVASCTVNQSSNSILDIYYYFNTNITVIYEDGSEETFLEVNINNTASFNISKLVGIKKPAVILLNSDDISYFRQIFSVEEVNYLLKNTNNIKSPINRLVIARELSEMVRSCQLSASSYITFALSMLKNDNDLFVLDFLLSSLLQTINKFVIFEEQQEYRNEFLYILQDFYYSKFIDLKNSTILAMLELLEYKNKEDFEVMLNFLQKVDKKSLGQSLLHSESEVVPKETDFTNFDLDGVTINTKRQLVQSIFEVDFFNINKKNEYSGYILGDNFDDKYFKYTLDAAQPSKDIKKTIWNHLVFSNCNEKSKVNISYMRGFARKSQYSLMKTYLTEKFFSDFAEVRKNHSVEYCIKFFKILNPSFVTENEVLVKFNNLRQTLDSNDFELIKEVDKVIADLFTCLKVSNIDLNKNNTNTSTNTPLKQ